MRATTGLVKGDTVSESSPEMDPKVLEQVAQELGRYVYMLVDPRNGIPFYVGKGQGTRFEAHESHAMSSLEAMVEQTEIKPPKESSSEILTKLERIRDIRAAGHRPEIWIVRYGMTAAEYTAVEAACIDLLRAMPVASVAEGSEGKRIPGGCKQQLTNARREKARGHGIELLQDIYREKAAPLLTTSTPLLIIKLGEWTDCPDSIPGNRTREGHGYKREWLPSEVRVEHYGEICDSAAGYWTFSEMGVKSRGIRYAFAAYRGVTRALMEIVPGTIEERYFPGEKTEKRRGFQYRIVKEGSFADEDEARLFEDVVGKHGRRLPKKVADLQTVYYWPQPEE